MGLVITAMSIPPMGRCQQPYNGTRQLNLCENFPPLKHAGSVSSLFKEKTFHSEGVLNSFESADVVYMLWYKGKYSLFSCFLNLLLREKKMGKVQVC